MARKKTQKKGKGKVLIIVGLVLSVTIFAFWIYKLIEPDFVRYNAFGIDIPNNYAIHGIDVSKYQRKIDWEMVKSMEVEDIKIGFVFIKATEGLGRVDGYFERNWNKSAEAGITRGAYHFFLAPKSGAIQAENFINTVELKRGDLPPVLDVEQTYGVSPDKLRKEVKEFLQTAEDHYGVKPIIYTNVDFYKKYLKGEFDDYPLWVAHYLNKNKPRIDRGWAFWQYSETGNVNGIKSKVDFNVFNGDSSEFEDLLID